MRDTDVQIVDAQVGFVDIELAEPLRLPRGDIRTITRAEVRLTVVDRSGTTASGLGTATLSPIWAWDVGLPDVATGDAAMRAAVQRLTALAVARDMGDPFEHADRISSDVPDAVARAAKTEGADPPPRLVGDVCLAAVDAACHDAWARAAGVDAYTLYGPHTLNQDLAAEFGPSLAGCWPGQGLLARPRSELAVSWLIGVGDDPVEAGRILADSQARWAKVKVAGSDPAADAEALVAVHRAFAEHAARGGRDPATMRISIDPNEAFAEAAPVIEMLDRVAARSPATRVAIAYVEQPFPRAADVPAAELSRVASRIPLVLDEGVGSSAEVAAAADAGWAGVAVKTSRGHSQALRLAAWCAATGRVLTVQDLTNTGPSLRHSARLAQRLPLTFDAFECNSLQLAPAANEEVGRELPGLVRINRRGVLELPTTAGLGLY